MFKSIQTYILVTLTAVLIWVIAESESVRVDTRRIDVRILPGPGTSRVFVVDPSQDFNGQVVVRLEGSTASLDAISSDLSRTIDLTPDMLNLPAGTGKFGSDLKAALRQHPVFRDRGVTPTETTPQSVTLDVDDMASRQIRVSVAPPEGVLLQGAPEPTPATVLLRLPSRLLSMLPEDAALIATLDSAAVLRLPPGRPQTVGGVRPELPPALRADPMAVFAVTEPTAVAVNLTVQSGTETIRVPSVPVTLRIAGNEYPNWDVRIDAEDLNITDVSVTGPRDLISQIEPGKKIQVFAVVPLDWQQLEAAAASGEPLVRDAMFVLSTEPGATVKFDAPDRSVRLTVRRRPPTPP